MQIFPTVVCNVTAWRHTGLPAYWLMALGAGGWGGIPQELQRLLSLFLSMVALEEFVGGA